MSYLAALGHVVYGVALNLLVGRAAWRLLALVPRAGAPAGAAAAPPSIPIPRLERWIAAAVIAAALVVLVVTVAGACGLLGSRAGVLALTAALALAVERATRAGAGAPRPGTPGAAAALGVAADGPVRLAALFVAVAALPILVSRLWLPPVAWDALTYHLRFPALWLRTGHLTTASTPMGDPSHTYYPLGGEMMLFWGLLSTGSDLLSSLSQAPFAVAAALGVAALAARAGAGTRVAALAGLCWLGTPAVLRQSGEAMLDVEHAAFAVCAVVFAVRYRDDGRRAWFFLSAAALGLLVGTKYSGLAFAPPILALLGWAARDAARRHGTRIGPRDALAGAVLVLALGGFAYARNLVAGGNPVLPLRIAIAGHTILPGSVGAAYYFDAASPRLGLRAFLASPRSLLEMGPVFAPLLLVPVAGWLAVRSGRTTAHDPALRRWLSGAALGMLLLGAAALPYREHRYFHAVTALAWSVLAGLVGGRARWASRGAVALLAIEAPLTLFYWAKDWMASGPVAGDLAGAGSVAALLVAVAIRRALPGASRATRNPPAAAPRVPGRVVSLAAAATLVLGLAGLVTAFETGKYDRWVRYFSERRPWSRLREPRADQADMASSWRVVAEATRDRRAVVAYAGNNAPYPLAGRGLGNVPLFVPRNDHERASFYDWGGPPPDPRSDPDSASWSRNVSRLGVRYLCVYREPPEVDPATPFPPERAWADADPGAFALVWSAPWARVYRVEERRAAAQPRE